MYRFGSPQNFTNSVIDWPLCQNDGLEKKIFLHHWIRIRWSIKSHYKDVKFELYCLSQAILMVVHFFALTVLLQLLPTVLIRETERRTSSYLIWAVELSMFLFWPSTMVSLRWLPPMATLTWVSFTRSPRIFWLKFSISASSWNLKIQGRFAEFIFFWYPLTKSDTGQLSCTKKSVPDIN